MQKKLIAGLLLAGALAVACDGGQTQPPDKDHGVEITEDVNGPTRKICDAVSKAYFDDAIITRGVVSQGTKVALLDLADNAGVAISVRSAVSDMYTAGLNPSALETRYKRIISACRRNGWS